MASNKLMIVGGAGALALFGFIGWRLYERTKYKQHLLSAWDITPEDSDAAVAAKQTALVEAQKSVPAAVRASIPWMSFVTAAQVIESRQQAYAANQQRVK